MKTKFLHTALLILLILTSVSCSKSGDLGSADIPEFKSYPDQVYYAGKQVVDVLNAVFYADKYICADEQQRENILRMYFRDSEVKYDEMAGTIEMTYEEVDNHKVYSYKISTGGLSLKDSGAQWDVSMRKAHVQEDEAYTFTICCLGKAHKVTGTILTDGVTDKDNFYNVVDFQFNVGEKSDIQYFDAEKIDQTLFRPVMTYNLNGTVATSVTNSDEVSSINSKLTSLFGYDPKSYFNDESIYTGYDAYFSTGRISTVITLNSGTEVSLESSVHTRSNWTVSTNGGEGKPYCPSQVRFGDWY